MKQCMSQVRSTRKGPDLYHSMTRKSLAGHERHNEPVSQSFAHVLTASRGNEVRASSRPNQLSQLFSSNKSERLKKRNYDRKAGSVRSHKIDTLDDQLNFETYRVFVPEDANTDNMSAISKALDKLSKREHKEVFFSREA